MSHFTCMIFGRDIETQMERYDENRRVERHKSGIVTDEDKQRFLDYYSEKDKTSYTMSDFDKAYELHATDWNGNEWEKDENGEWCEYSTYNPNSKYDWYMVGGRWTGEIFTKLKEGADAVLTERNYGEESWCTKNGRGIDSIEKRWIDIDGIRNEAEQNAKQKYTSIEALFADGKIPQLPMTLYNLKKSLGDDYKKAREIYNEYDAIKEWRKVINPYRDVSDEKYITGYEDLEDFQCSLEDYAKRQREGVMSTYAIVKDGEWYSRGDMGWFGISKNDKSDEEWFAFVNKMIDEADDDELITILDCHI